MAEGVSRIRTGPGRHAALGLVVALLLATAVDAGLWAVRHGGFGGRAGSVGTVSRGHVASPLLTSPYSNALLVGAGHRAAYFIFWSNSNGKLQGQISQFLIEPALQPGQKAPGTDTTGDSFTGTVTGSRVKMTLAGNGLNGVRLITGRIRSGHLLSLSDPVAGHGVIAFRTEKNLDRFTMLFNRMYYREYDRRRHGRP